MKIIYVDFDGVINSYKTKFVQDKPTYLPDPPVDGAIKWLCKLVEHFHVVIFTCRMLHPESEAAIHTWLGKHGMPNHLIDQLSFSCTKRGAEVYIDDRAWRFEGTFPTLEELDSFKPWNKRKPEGWDCACSPLNKPHSENCKAWFPGDPTYEGFD